MTVFVLAIDAPHIDLRDAVTAHRTEEAAKTAAQADHDARRYTENLDRFELSWTRDDHYSLADDVALSVDYFVLTLEVGS